MAPPDTRIVLDTSTKLAVERNRLAYERTLMAWVRTGVSLISFGFASYKFFEEFRKAEQLPRSNELFGVREFGFIMICIGLVVVLLATIQHIRTMHKLRAQYVDVPYSLAAVVALLVAILGILALIGVIFRQ
jgi:inner membrane protein YidH